MDYELIEAVCKVCQLSSSKSIYFINLIRDFHVPDDVVKEFPDILDKALEQRQSEIKDLIDDHFSCPGVKINYVVKQGQATKEIMKFAEKEKVDLIVLGRKNEKKGGGVLINRLARRAGCSILVIPKGTEFKMDRMLVPLDFSSYSQMALEKAIELTRASKNSNTIITQNVYQVPSGYHYTGKTFEEFGKIMKNHAKNDYKKFLQNIDTSDVNIETTYTLDKDDDVIAEIYDHAKDTKSDVIMFGAKGRTAATALFIGSKAEKLIQMDSDIPMMVIRPKGMTAGFREAIQEL